MVTPLIDLRPELGRETIIRTLLAQGASLAQAEQYWAIASGEIDGDVLDPVKEKAGPNQMREQRTGRYAVILRQKYLKRKKKKRGVVISQMTKARRGKRDPRTIKRDRLGRFARVGAVGVGGLAGAFLARKLVKLGRKVGEAARGAADFEKWAKQDEAHQEHVTEAARILHGALKRQGRVHRNIRVHYKPHRATRILLAAILAKPTADDFFRGAYGGRYGGVFGGYLTSGKGYNPKQPRWPRGDPKGGQWRPAGASGPLGSAIEFGTYQPTDFDRRYGRESAGAFSPRQKRAAINGVLSAVRAIESVIDLTPARSLWLRHDMAASGRRSLADYLGDFISDDTASPSQTIERLNVYLRGRISGSTGHYSPLTNSITIQAGHRDAAEIFTHEFGHLLDYKVFGRAGQPGSSLLRGGFFPPMRGIMNVLVGSHLRRQLTKIVIRGYAISKTGRRIKGFNLGDRSAYLTENVELFARAFTQWIGKKSGHPGILRTVRKGQSSVVPEFWGWTYFRVIENSFDNLFDRSDILRLKEDSFSSEADSLPVEPLEDTGLEEVDLRLLDFEAAVQICVDELGMNDSYARRIVSVIQGRGGDIDVVEGTSDKAYNPKQPRWGKGNPKGGQWRKTVSGEFLTGGRQRAAREVIRRAEGLHGKLPAHTVRVTRGLPHGTGARFEGGTIRLSQRSKTPHLDTAHELGHLLDSAFSRRGAFGSLEGAGLNAWRKAVDKSPLVRRWRAWEAMGHIALGGQRFLLPKANFRYALDRRELFARSYAQYLTRKRGNRRMRRELRVAQRRPLTYYWNDREFRPIERSLDRLFGIR